MYLDIPYKIQYDTNRFDFKSIIEEVLLEGEKVNLDEIHKLKEYQLLERKKDQSTMWHKRYYDSFREKVEPLYKELIKELKEYFNYETIIYQDIPTFRVQLSGNIAVGEWHKDSTYNHGKTEVNFWLPFTDTNEYNTIWMESKIDKGDYKPYKVNYGEILVFNGANLMHGNKTNTSNKTRVSIDFRMVEEDKFIPNENGSININRKFIIGEYFKII